MKLVFTKLDTPAETIQVSFDNGTTWGGGIVLQN